MFAFREFTFLITNAVWFLFFSLCSTSGMSQDFISKQLDQPVRLKADEVVDSRYGIRLYQSLVARLSGDSIRHCKGYACSGWVKDYYTTGKILHKGYYLDGQITSYTNYYPNGQIERVFRELDDLRAISKMYYPSGKLKSEVKYRKDSPIRWRDYYENGTLEYEEELKPKHGYYSKQISYYEDGTVKSALTLEKKRKLLFSKIEYYPSGQVKSKGTLLYNMSYFDYQRKGTWQYFNEDGSLEKSEKYVNGKLVE